MNGKHCSQCQPSEWPKTDGSVKEVNIPNAGKMWLCQKHDPYRTDDLSLSMRDTRGVWYAPEQDG